MYLDNFETMDPVMLMSIINMKLRDEFNGDFHELIKTYTLDQSAVEKKLATAGFEFVPAIGQFR